MLGGFNNNINIIAVITNKFGYGYIIGKPYLTCVEFINLDL